MRMPGEARGGLPQPWLDILDHPDFPRAAHGLASNMLRACDEDPQLAAVFRDAGRYLTAMCAAHLHGTGGITLPMLKQICGASGFLSPGRARTLLQFLHYVDYVRPAEATSRPTRYRATDRFTRAWRRHLELALLAAREIDPGVERLLVRFAYPGVYEAFLGVQAQRLLGLTQQIDPFPALRAVFLHPYAGSQILWQLLSAVPSDDFPHGGSVPAVLAQMARRFGVAPLQVRRIMRHAEREDILRYDRRGSVTFGDAGRPAIRIYCAFQLAELIACAEETLAGLPPGV